MKEELQRLKEITTSIGVICLLAWILCTTILVCYLNFNDSSMNLVFIILTAIIAIALTIVFIPKFIKLYKELRNKPKEGISPTEELQRTKYFAYFMGVLGLGCLGVAVFLLYKPCLRKENIEIISYLFLAMFIFIMLFIVNISQFHKTNKQLKSKKINKLKNY